MAKVATSISIDADVKAKAVELFADCGMDLSTAINIFLRQAIRENGIPFSIQRDVPNFETMAAIREAEELTKHPEKYKRYNSFDALINEVRDDA